MAIQTTTTLGGTPLGSLDMLPIYLKKKLLPVLKKKLVFHQLGDAEDLPLGSGKSVRWIRYERIGAPFIPLVEGVTPTTLRDIPISTVEATVDQWGDIAGITDLAELTVFHKAFQIIQERLATQALEVIDRECQRTLEGGSNILFPDPNIASRDQIAAGNVLNINTIQRAIANLRDYGGPDWDNGDYMGVFNPRVEQDLWRDELFQSAAVYGSQVPLMNGEVGRIAGVRWMRSNFIPGIAASTAIIPASMSTPAASGGETALGGDKDVQLVGIDLAGFEVLVSTITNAGAWTSGDVIAFTVPTLATGIYAYNIYAGVASSGAMTLQAEAQAPGVFHLTGNGVAASGKGIAYSTTGRAAPIKPATGVIVYPSYIFARDSFGVLTLDPIEVMVTPNTPSDSDPMKQRRKVSWKTIFKAVIKNPNFYYRIESASAFN